MGGYFKTAILMAGMTALFIGIGFLIAGRDGMVIAFVLAGGMNLWAWYNSDKAVLKKYGAQPVTRSEAPELYAMVERLARNSNIPMPKLYIIDSDQPNAFATGRNPDNAAVAVNKGLLARLKPDEVEGVIAHELSHVIHRDTLIMTVTATFAGAISMLSHFGMYFGGGNNRNRSNPIAMLAVVFLAPMAAMIVQMAISRSREFEADRMGAQICGKPRSLANALAAISGDTKTIPNIQAEQNPASAHMFIINPLRMTGMQGLFTTHPPTEERIRRLMEMDSHGDFVKRAAIDETFGNPLDNFGSTSDFGHSSKKNPWA